MAVASSPKSDEQLFRCWQSEEDIRALQRVAEITKDKPRMARARKMIKEQKAALDAAAKV